MEGSYPYHILWKIDQTEVQPENAKSALSDIRSQVETQTDVDIITGRVHDFDITAGIVVTYFIGVGSALTAQIIADKLKSLSGTEGVVVKTKIETGNDEEISNTDIDIDIDIDTSVDKE